MRITKNTNKGIVPEAFRQKGILPVGGDFVYEIFFFQEPW